MSRQHPLYHAPPREVVTLDIGAEMPGEFPMPSAPSDPAPVDESPGTPRVLLLEDRDDFREVLRDHLADRGFKVVSVPSGVDGLYKVKESAFDLIICDMMMPRGGGEMFYWAVTRLRPGTAKRFIFFTGHKNNPAIDFFFKRVNATVLAKPFELSKLEETMRAVLRRLV